MDRSTQVRLLRQLKCQIEIAENTLKKFEGKTEEEIRRMENEGDPRKRLFPNFVPTLKANRIKYLSEAGVHLAELPKAAEESGRSPSPPASKSGSEKGSAKNGSDSGTSIFSKTLEEERSMAVKDAERLAEQQRLQNQEKELFSFFAQRQTELPANTPVVSAVSTPAKNM